MIEVSQSEQFELIRRYQNIDESINLTKECKIGVGYNTCKDVNFRAVDLFKVLEPEIKELG